ncbi:MAG: hypothetical protein JW809_19425 [Pirellulales bacterium]|nr:hypothetical protein [Pirellulales bacterium]
MNEFQVEQAGRLYTTGCLPRETKVGERFPIWSPEIPACPIVPRAQWIDQEGLEWAEYEDIDQDGDPACCLASAGNAGEFHLSLCGREKVSLDWHRAWMDLSGGRGGVALDTALAYLLEKGFPIKGSTERLFAHEVWDCGDSIERLVSGVQKGCRGIYGRFIGRGGHAEFPAYTRRDGSKAVFHVRGTWGREYGTNGWYPVTESQIEAGLGVFGAFLVREFFIRPADALKLPDIKA